MRVGIIGLGNIGIVHLDAWRSVTGAKVVAASDPSPTARRRGRAAGLKMYKSATLLLEQERPDAVSICTPPANHAELAILCLKRGVHVLCEKPLALTTWDALKMIQAASGAKRHLLLATKFRHVPDLVRARKLIAAKAIGEPVCFEIGFCSAVEMSKRWNSSRPIAGGGVIIDNGCHAFDIVSFLFGAVTRVQATLLKPIQKLAVEDSAIIQVQAPDEVVGTIDLSWSLNTRRRQYLTVHGSQGTIDIGWTSSGLTTGQHRKRRIGRGYNKLTAHRRMFNRFAKVIRGREAPWISPVECLRTVSAVEAAYRSVHSGGWAWVDTREMLDRAAGAKRLA